MVNKFIAVLNANAKTYQIDKTLQERAQPEKAQDERVVADTNKNEDVCLDEEDLEEALLEVDTPAANTRSRVRSGQRSVTQEALTTVLDISGMGYMLTPKITSSRKFPKKFFTEMAAAVLDGDTGMLIEYRHLTKRPKYKAIWRNNFGNEDGRFAQGMPGMILKEKATNTMFFIMQDEIPRDRQRDVTYAQIVCNYCDQKKEEERTRITMGGDRTNCPFDYGTPQPQIFLPSNSCSTVLSPSQGQNS